MNYVETAKRAKKDSFLLSSISEGIRNSALSLICEKLRENQDYIFAEIKRIFRRPKKMLCRRHCYPGLNLTAKSSQHV